MQENEINNDSKDTLFKPKYGRNEMREMQRNRIFDEIVAHCYTKSEFYAAWHKYLNECLIFPFQADIAIKVNNSGEKAVKIIDILELTAEESSEGDIRAKAETAGEYAYFYVSLLALQNVQGSKSTRQAIDDWQYWNSDYF